MGERILFYDTETTGLPGQSGGLDAQPHLVQVGAVLFDMETRKELSSIDLTVCADGWDIPPRSVSVHGITAEQSKVVGVKEKAAFNIFWQLWRRSTLRVGHNEGFDDQIMRYAIERYSPNEAVAKSAVEAWRWGRAICTMGASKNVLKIPPTSRQRAAGFHSYKNPNLSEAYEAFFGKQFEGAHTALADTRACMDIFFELERKAEIKYPKTRK